MKSVAVQRMWEVAEGLEDLITKADRSRDGAGEFHDEAQEVQLRIAALTREAIALARRMEAAGGEAEP